MLLTLPCRQIRSSRRRPAQSAVQSPAELIEPRLCLSATSTATCPDDFACGFDGEYEAEESLTWAEDSDWIEFEWMVDSIWEENWALEEVELRDEFSEQAVISLEFEPFTDEFAWLEDDWDAEWFYGGPLESDWLADAWEADGLIMVEYVASLTSWLYDDLWCEGYEEIPFGEDALMPDTFGNDALLPDEPLAALEETAVEELVVLETVVFIESDPTEFTPDDFADSELGEGDFDTGPIEPGENDRPGVETQSRPMDSSTVQHVAGLGVDESGHRDVANPDLDSKVTEQHHSHRSQRESLRETNVNAARSRSRFAAKLATSHFPITSSDRSAGREDTAAKKQQFTPRELAVRQFREARTRIQVGQPVNSEALRAAIMSEAAMETSGPRSVAGWNDAVWSSERLTMALSELPDPLLDDASNDDEVTCAQFVSAAGAAAIAGSFGFQFAERRGFDLLRRLTAIILRRV